jgi:uncharacterized RDD family membrane protein YckC
MDNQNIYAPPLSELESSKDQKLGHELASRWSRLGGSLIDSIISIVAIFPVMYFTGTWEQAMNGGIPIFETVLLGIYGVLVFLALNGYLLAKHGQTIGKKITGTRIVSIHSNTILPLGNVLFLRYLPLTIASYIPVAGQFIVTIDSLFIFRESKQCIHDQIASTKVVKVSAHS